MYLPIIVLDRSQQIRIGKAAPDFIGPTKQGTTPVLFHAMHVNLNDPLTRRDLQRHAAIGAWESIGTPTTKFADLYTPSATPTTTAATSSVTVATFQLASRIFTDQVNITVPALTGATAIATPASTLGDLFYLLRVDHYGNVTAITGAASVGAPTYEVDTVTVSSGSATGTLTWTYAGYNYSVAFTAAETATALATAFAGASSNNGGPTMAQLGAIAGTNVVGTGGALGTAGVVLTFSGIMEGAVTNQAITTSTGTATYVATTAGANGAVRPTFDGNIAPLNYIFVAQNSTTPVVGPTLTTTS